LDTALEAEFNLIASYVALAIECGAVFGRRRSGHGGLLKAITNGQAGEIEGCQIWLRFATWILLLEFAPAADIFAHRSPPT
jgi:hypothetical protein